MERAHEGNTGPTPYDHADTVREYYDLCTEFMEFGWGDSLHFAPLSRGKAWKTPSSVTQRRIIAMLELSKGMKVVDIGCGIAVRCRRVVQESGAFVLGVNSNAIQLEKAKSLNDAAGIGHLVDYLACSFMDMSAIPDNSFDRGYAIESTCHAPDKAGAFAEIFRVLKPGPSSGARKCASPKVRPWRPGA